MSFLDANNMNIWFKTRIYRYRHAEWCQSDLKAVRWASRQSHIRNYKQAEELACRQVNWQARRQK